MLVVISMGTPRDRLGKVPMFKVLVLICATSTTGPECNIHSAVDVITTGHASSVQQCGFLGQALLATTSLVPEPGKQYMKVVCARDQVAEAGR